MITNDTITTIDHLRDALDELNYEVGVDRATIILYNGTRPVESLFFLVATDPDGEWFFLADRADNGKWRHVRLDELPPFTGSHLVAAA